MLLDRRMGAVVLVSCLVAGPLLAEGEESFRRFEETESHSFRTPENGPRLTLKLIPSADKTRMERVEVYGRTDKPIQTLDVPRMDQPLMEQAYFRFVESEPVSYYGFKILTKERFVSATPLHDKGIAAFWSFWKYDPITQRFVFDELMSQIPDPRFRPDGTFETWLTKDEAGWERSTFVYHNGQPERTVLLEGRLEQDGYRCYEIRYSPTILNPVKKKMKCPSRESLARPTE